MIRASSAKEVDALIKDLGSDSRVARDAAIARLTVIGARAVERLVAVAADGSAASSVRAATLRILEGIGDHRALDVALQRIDDWDLSIATAAIGVARVFVADPHGLAAVDRLTGVVLDRTRPEPLRLAAFRALEHLDATTLRPLREALKDDLGIAVRPPGPSGRTGRSGRGARLLRLLEDATLPQDPELLKRALATAPAETPLTTLHALLERIREREIEEEPAERRAWMAARGAVHAVLAARGSLLGLYDLRESIASAREPLPVEFVAALTTLGDASCLESIASAFARYCHGARDSVSTRRPSSVVPPTGGTDWWLHHLALAFAAIVTRERITRRSAAIKKIERRWPTILEELWPRKPLRTVGATR